MNGKVLFNSLLVPTDFSVNAWSAFQFARQLIDGDDSEIVVMHAIDPAIIRQIVQFGGGEHDEVLARMRQFALQGLKEYSDESDKAVHIDTLVCEGEPFFEIIRKADDFAVDAIVMSKTGESRQANSLLFGSTAEKVIRGSRKPVIVLPDEVHSG
jgi:nucleotide-binding universal stress UspA family protein